VLQSGWESSKNREHEVKRPRGVRRVWSVAVAMTVGIGALHAQSTAPGSAQGQPTPVFRTGTTAVLLDIVVRDKRGRPIRDLRQDEITVLRTARRAR
jgi:hypothetical protein